MCRFIHFFFFSFFLLFFFSLPLCAKSSDHGFSLFGHYDFFGYSFPGSVPYGEENSSEKGTVSTSGSIINSTSDFLVGGNYFYQKIMGEVSYNRITADNIVVEDSRVAYDDAFSYDIDAVDLKIGLRLANFGNNSFTFLYGGVRSLWYSSSYVESELSGNALFVGVKGFYTFFPALDCEPLLYVDGHLGRYINSTLSTSLSKSSTDRIKSITAELTLGVGVNYEPYEVALLAITKANFEQMTHRVAVDGGDVDFGIRHSAIYVGCMVLYQNFL